MTQEILYRLHADKLANINKRISDFKDGYRQNIALIGEEGSGKTTVLKSLTNNPPIEELFYAYIEVPEHEFRLFAKRCVNSILYNFLKKSQLLSSRENLELLVKMAKERLPLTAQLIESFLSRLDKDKHENLFKDLFSVFESFANEIHKKLVIIFDEFHRINEFGSKSIWHELSKKIMFEKYSLFIFASSSKNEAKQILANELSLLFGNFETIELEILDNQECAGLMRHSLKNVSIDNDLLSFVINFTGAHPFYIKTIGDNTSAECQRLGEHNLTRETLIRVLKQLLFDDWGVFNLKFSLTLSQITSTHSKNDCKMLLSAISCGSNKLRDLSSKLRKNSQEINQRLKKLIEQGILSKNGSFYSLNDRLMNFWLKFVLTEKLNALSPNHDEQAMHFMITIEHEIENFIQTSHKAFADRMLDLFNQFENDDIHLEKKRLQLSQFKELKLIHFENKDLKVGIFAKAQDSLWLAAIKESGIAEQDVNEFIQSAKNFKHKTINKIIISLGNIERNARLLAKESHILTWDIANINCLMDLYGKPRIIK